MERVGRWEKGPGGGAPGGGLRGSSRRPLEASRPGTGQPSDVSSRPRAPVASRWSDPHDRGHGHDGRHAWSTGHPSTATSCGRPRRHPPSTGSAAAMSQETADRKTDSARRVVIAPDQGDQVGDVLAEALRRRDERGCRDPRAGVRSGPPLPGPPARERRRGSARCPRGRDPRLAEPGVIVVDHRARGGRGRERTPGCCTPAVGWENMGPAASRPLRADHGSGACAARRPWPTSGDFERFFADLDVRSAGARGLDDWTLSDGRTGSGSSTTGSRTHSRRGVRVVGGWRQRRTTRRRTTAEVAFFARDTTSG